jgi:hypothetical protein
MPLSSRYFRSPRDLADIIPVFLNFCVMQNMGWIACGVLSAHWERDVCVLIQEEEEEEPWVLVVVVLVLKLLDLWFESKEERESRRSGIYTPI